MFDGLRLGLTMRMARAEGYDEWRDCIAADWRGFLRQALPSATWMPIPNFGGSVRNYLDTLGVNAVILTGGNDIGEHASKDETDFAVLDHALAHRWPVLGVCRGMQVLQAHFGGKLTRVSKQAHVATRHTIELLPAATRHGLSQPPSVNSFHEMGTMRANVADRLQPLALCDDGSVEAVSIREYSGLGVMWHPERDRPAAESDIAMVRALFSGLISA